MSLLIASYLLLVFALPVALSGLVNFRSLPVGRRCPHCTGDTISLRTRRIRIANILLTRTQISQRWCLDCGWEGVMRHSREQRQPALEAAAAGARTAQPTTQTLDVRSLSIDGSAWRVMLQCWRNTGHYYGRLVFVGPTGRLWLDAVESFNGATQTEVLGQALSLPDRLLQNRLRRLVSG